MASIGYARISTAMQNLEAQEDQLRAAGCSVIYSDIMSGANASRPEWDACRKALREGDTLMITKLDRAGRSLWHLLEISNELTAKGVTLKVLDQAIDTSTPAGRFAFQMIGSVAEFERSLISERTRSAMASRPRGRNGGRPKAMTPKMRARAQHLYDARELTVKEIAAAAGVSVATLYREIETDRKRTAAVRVSVPD